MKKSYKIDSAAPIPVVAARAEGILRNRPLSLVFDTGAFMTQLTTSVVEELGYFASDGISSIIAMEPSGPLDEGYTVKFKNLKIFVKQFSNITVAAYDFSNLEKEEIDGLLGFDIIRQLHLEMNGPAGEFVVYT